MGPQDAHKGLSYKERSDQHLNLTNILLDISHLSVYNIPI